MIALALNAMPMAPTEIKLLRKMVHGMMEKDGNGGHSASGRSALMAIEWCEEHAEGWTLTHLNGGGYMVKAVPL